MSRDPWGVAAIRAETEYVRESGDRRRAMEKLNDRELDLLVALRAMTPAQLREWETTPQPFDPGVNSARVLLTLEVIR